MTDAELDALEDLIARAHFATYNGRIHPATESLYLAVREKGPRLIAELRKSRDRIAEMEQGADCADHAMRIQRLVEGNATLQARIAELEAAIGRAKTEVQRANFRPVPGSAILYALYIPPEATEMEAQHEG